MSNRAELERFTSELDALLGIGPDIEPVHERLGRELGALASPEVLYVSVFHEFWEPRQHEEVTESESKVFAALGDLGFRGAKDTVKTKKIVDEQDVTVATSFRYGGRRVEDDERLLMMRKTYEVFDPAYRLRGGVHEILVFNAMVTPGKLRKETDLRSITIDRFEEYAKWAKR